MPKAQLLLLEQITKIPLLNHFLNYVARITVAASTSNGFKSSFKHVPGLFTRKKMVLYDEGEKQSFLRAIRYVADSTRSTEELLRDGVHPLLGNHSNSISLVETTQYPEEARARDNPNCFVVCPTVSVSIGDFLGVLPGQLRYQNFQASRKAVLVLAMFGWIRHTMKHHLIR